MVGTDDRLVREANSYIIRQTLGCRLIKFDEVGHGLPGECADEINQELLGKKVFFLCVENISISIDLFESDKKTSSSKKAKREIPEEYATEIKALEQCCQHRTHCLVYNAVGMLQVEIN
jgi:hypothetical protein